MEFQLSYFKSWKMMLWKCCTQYTNNFGKLSSGHRNGKGQFSFQSEKKAKPKTAYTTTQLHSSHASKLSCSVVSDSLWPHESQHARPPSPSPTPGVHSDTWAFGSVIMNKASGGDGIPVELFQILKDDAVKVLHSICQQFWKTQQWPQDWKRSVFIRIPKKGNAKECSNYRTVALISHASKVMLKILQARLQQYMNCEFQGVQAEFSKGRGTRDQIANIHWIIKKAREFQKNIYLCLLTMPKSLCGSQ